MKYLLFQLYGQLQAWGSPAAGLVRKTDDHPTKSGILGLIGACMGINSSSEDELLKLQSSLGFSCREDIPGKPLIDFHTVQPDDRLSTYYEKIRKNLPIEKPDNLILTYRQYLTDAFFTICLWEQGDIKLETVSDALSHPVYTPYLGRRCCPLGLPFGQIIVSANNLKEAFDQFIPDRASALSLDRFALNPRVFWEGSDTSITVKNRYTRKDLLNCRRTWSYTQREELEGVLERRAGCITKAA